MIAKVSLHILLFTDLSIFLCNLSFSFFRMKPQEIEGVKSSSDNLLRMSFGFQHI